MERFNHLKIRELKTLKEKISSDITRIKSSMEEVDSSKLMDENKQSDNLDVASVDLANSQILRMRNRESFYAKKLEMALKKFDSKEYGLCEDCGDEIKFTRLNARPTAELCINCKEESEKNENVMFVKKSHSYSEAVDLQK